MVTVLSVECFSRGFCRFLPVFASGWFLNVGLPVPPVSTVVTPPSPYFRRVLLAFFLGCLVDDFSASIMLTSAVLKGSLDIRRQSPSAGVVLTCAPSMTRPRQGDPKPDIAALAKPAQIVRRAVRLVAVNVVNDGKAARSAYRALGGQGRAAFWHVSSIPLRPVRN